MKDKKAVLERFDAAINTGDLDVIAQAIDEAFHPDVAIGQPLPIEATGAEAIKQLWAMLLTAFPDLQVHVEDVVEEGDKLAVRNTVTGTNLGVYLGRPPTGKPVAYGEMFVLRFVDGRVAQTWGVVDVAGQMMQLGLI